MSKSVHVNCSQVLLDWEAQDNTIILKFPPLCDPLASKILQTATHHVILIDVSHFAERYTEIALPQAALAEAAKVGYSLLLRFRDGEVYISPKALAQTAAAAAQAGLDEFKFRFFVRQANSNAEASAYNVKPQDAVITLLSTPAIPQDVEELDLMVSMYFLAENNEIIGVCRQMTTEANDNADFAGGEQMEDTYDYLNQRLYFLAPTFGIYTAAIIDVE
jgi:hypothetical protein